MKIGRIFAVAPVWMVTMDYAMAVRPHSGSKEVLEMRRDDVARVGPDDRRHVGAVVVLGNDGIPANLNPTGICCQVDLDLIARMPVVARCNLTESPEALADRPFPASRPVAGSAQAKQSSRFCRLCKDG